MGRNLHARINLPWGSGKHKTIVISPRENAAKRTPQQSLVCVGNVWFIRLWCNMAFGIKWGGGKCSHFPVGASILSNSGRVVINKEVGALIDINLRLNGSPRWIYFLWQRFFIFMFCSSNSLWGLWNGQQNIKEGWEIQRSINRNCNKLWGEGHLVTRHLNQIAANRNVWRRLIDW